MSDENREVEWETFLLQELAQHRGHIDRERRAYALGQLVRERRKQLEDKGWSLEHDKEHHPLAWVAILAYELGCMSDTALNENEPDHVTRLRSCATKIGAVCLAMLEAHPLG